MDVYTFEELSKETKTSRYVKALEKELKKPASSRRLSVRDQMFIDRGDAGGSALKTNHSERNRQSQLSRQTSPEKESLFGKSKPLRLNEKQ